MGFQDNFNKVFACAWNHILHLCSNSESQVNVG
jgi:hypothetical protein